MPETHFHGQQGWGRPQRLVLVAGEVAIQPPAPQAFPGPGPSRVTLPCCCHAQGLCLLPSSRSPQVCEPPAGRDPAVQVRGSHRWGGGRPPLPGSHEASSEEEAGRVLVWLLQLVL